jgi:hypothetical protein
MFADKPWNKNSVIFAAKLKMTTMSTILKFIIATSHIIFIVDGEARVFPDERG